MQPRRITITLGAAVGGLLAGAFFQAAVAFADETSPVPNIDVFGFMPVGPETVDSTTGIPGLFEDYGGTQVFAIPDVGEFVGNVDTTTTTFGGGGEQVIVTNDPVPDGTDEVVGSSQSELPGAGSVYDVAAFAGFTNEYSDVLTGGTSAGGTVTDTLVTPFGTDIDLTWLFADFPVAVAPTDALMAF